MEEFKQLNEKILNDKKRILIENARREKEEYDFIIKKQLAEKEKDRREEEIKQRKIYENNNDLIKLIKMKEEKEKMKIKEVKEEGKKEKQIRDDWKLRMENIKKQKINELRNLGIKDKYIASLENYKII